MGAAALYDLSISHVLDKLYPALKQVLGSVLHEKLDSFDNTISTLVYPGIS